MSDGRPLRFLAGVLGVWTAIRLLQLWHATRSLPGVVHALVPPGAAAILPPTMPDAHTVKTTRSSSTTAQVPARQNMRVVVYTPVSAPEAPATARVARQTDPPAPGVIIAPLRPAPIAEGDRRLTGSAWLIARGGASGTLSGGQLGASQAGLRIAYALDSAHRVALTARIASPLSGRGREAAAGVEWQPTTLPIRLIAEQRVSLDGGRGGATIGIIGGYGPAEILRGVRIEAYGQAGAIHRDGIEGFIDTAARLTHPTAGMRRTRVDLGIGVWGSAQRGAARFDVGPTAGLSVPAAGHILRLSLDWRQRIAGNARPGSGPAFSIGSDF